MSNDPLNLKMYNTYYLKKMPNQIIEKDGKYYQLQGDKNGVKYFKYVGQSDSKKNE